MRAFKIIEPGELNLWIQISERIGVAAGPILKNAAFELAILADSAADFFRGLFPSQAPYFPEEYIFLPWHDEYWASTDGVRFTPSSIGDEAGSIADRLGKIDPNAASPALFGQALDPAWREKSYMQGLAVETMLLSDGGLSLLIKANLVEAIPWLIAAHQRIIDCTCQAHRILYPTASSRSGASSTKCCVRSPGRLM